MIFSTVVLSFVSGTRARGTAPFRYSSAMGENMRERKCGRVLDEVVSLERNDVGFIHRNEIFAVCSCWRSNEGMLHSASCDCRAQALLQLHA